MLKSYFVIFVVALECYCFPYNSVSTENEEVKINDVGAPVILTPLLKEGKIKEAQEASIVDFKEFKGVSSYAAYFTVDDIYKSNLFFWFFPSQNDYANAPVILWLQGGPGGSSLVGLFLEHGPFSVTNKHGLKIRQYSWVENHSVIYVDNPVGTGYSFTDKDGYAQNQTIIGTHLYKAMLQFFQLFPELQKNNFFIAGESYAGKYVPALAYTIYKNNPNAKQKIYLQGVSIGNGFCDPEHQVDYGSYLYQIGIIDVNEREMFYKLQDEILKFVHNKEWAKASEAEDQLIASNITLFKNITKFENYYNYLNSNPFDEVIESVNKYVQRDDIRKAIHVGNALFQSISSTVRLNLKEEKMQSVAPWISELLDHYRFLIYSGQLDIVIAYPLTLNFLQHLNFSAANEYKTAKRKPWYVDSQLAGYVKQAGNLNEVLVRNAGHLVPMDQPQWALDLITKFTRNKPFTVV